MTLNGTHGLSRFDAVKADHPLVDYLGGIGVALHGSGSVRTTNQCPNTEHAPGHRPVSVFVDENRWKCNDCGKHGSVIDWVMLSENVDTKGAMEKLGAPQPSGSSPSQKPSPSFSAAPKAQPRIAQTFDYTDEGGNVLYQTVRYEPKDFRQRRPDGKGWAYDLRGTRRVLFHLPDLLARPSENVYVTEGEKKGVILAERTGLLVTTSAGGAKAADKTDWSPLSGRTVTILPDNDDAGVVYAQAVSDILHKLEPPASVRTVNLPGLPKKGDCVEWLHARPSVPADELVRELEALPAEANTTPPARIFSVRTGAEILAMTLPEDDCILGDRVMAAGQSLVLAGPAGVGKSRLLQLAACTITGEPFLGLVCHRHNLRWLIFQTENGLRRLKFDLGKLAARFGHGVLDYIHVHTVENDTDGYVALGNPENVTLMRKAVENIQPDIVAFDPLYAFSQGDLNTDSEMAGTVLTASTIAKAGNPLRMAVIVHHSLSGKAGAAKATGYDRGSFTRNSKALTMWTRSQINVVPAGKDDNGALLLSCGKNSNGKEFEPIGCRLNPEQMIYEEAPDITAETLASAIEDNVKQGRKCTVEQAAEVLSGLGKPARKSTFVKAITEETGIGRARAYEIVEEAEKARCVAFNKAQRTYTPRL